MNRSVWKFPHLKYKLVEQAFNKTKDTRLVTYERSSIISPGLINSVIFVHNGSRFVGVKITENHVGFKLGQFVLTKKRVFHKKKVTKRKNEPIKN